MINCVFFFSDTEGSFIVERLVDIAESAIHHLKGVAKASSNNGTIYRYVERERERGGRGGGDI